MNIIFIGNVEFSRTTLVRLIELKANVVGVLSQERSTFNSDLCDLSVVARAAGIQFKPVKNINTPDVLDWIRARAPDFIFCFGFSQLLSENLLRLAPKGVIGFHPALLPSNRGRHPIIWTLALGLKEAGSTFFFINEGVDSGDILNQEKIAVTYNDTARTLYDKITSVALGQIETFLPQLESGNYNKIVQAGSKTNYWRKRTGMDGRIDFRMTSRSIYNLVRALSKPYVGAHACFGGEEIKIWRAVEKKSASNNLECGRVLGADKSGILVKCDGGAILLAEHEFKTLPKSGEYLS